MMLMAMRPQKTQLTSVYKYTAPGAATFAKRDQALMFGYQNYDAFITGGAGGRSGYVQTTFFDSSLGQNVTTTMYGCGGGGGASRLLTGKLTDLPASVALAVGGPGNTGGDAVGPNTTSIGGQGGTSTFNGVSVEGGFGGHTGTIQSSGAMTTYSEGGQGGAPNSAPADRPLGGQAITNRAPAAGGWDVNVKWGSGGGGGIGRIDTHYGTAGGPQNGAGGAGDVYFAGGEGVSGAYGGGGAGANAGPLQGLGSDDHGTGWQTGKNAGVVVVKLS